jgi:hypothetical protein
MRLPDITCADRSDPTRLLHNVSRLAAGVTHHGLRPNDWSIEVDLRKHALRHRVFRRFTGTGNQSVMRGNDAGTWDLLQAWFNADMPSLEWTAAPGRVSQCPLVNTEEFLWNAFH